MSGPENTFIASIHRQLPVDLYHMKTHNEYISGPADVWYSAAKDLWVEYKFLVLPKRDTTVIDLTAGKSPMLSVLQQEWLSSRYDEGRRVCVVVGCKEGGVIMEHKTWLQPRTTKEFKAALLSRKGIAEAILAYLE